MINIDNQIVEYIKSYGIEHGYLPTVRDVSKGLNITQSRAFSRFKTLENRGVIIREGQKYSIKCLKYVSSE